MTMKKVSPIKDRKKIEDIKKLLSNNPRDYCLFVCGINNGLRGGDLLSLKVYQVRDKKVGDYVEIIEKKTGKPNYFYLNKSCLKSIQKIIKEYKLNDEDYLFPSRKGRGRLYTYSLNRLVQSWCESVGLSGDYGSHSLRKTWGYHQRKTFGVSWELISKRYNHSNPSITRRYLGISNEEVQSVCMNEIWYIINWKRGD